MSADHPTVSPVVYSRVRSTSPLAIDTGQPELFVGRQANGGYEIAVDPWSVVRKSGSEPALDPAAMADILARPLLPAEPFRSLLAGVYRVPTWGTALDVNGDIAVIDGDVPCQSVLETIAQSVDRLDDTLRCIVLELLQGATNPAVLCSGGLDSAVVAAVVASLTKSPPTLVTVTGDVLSPAEIPLIESVVQFLGARWITISEGLEFRLSDVRALNVKSAWPAGGVFSTAWRVATERCVEQGIDLLLTGEGANEICSPDGAEALDLAATCDWVEAAKALGRARDTQTVTALKYLRHAWSNRFLPTRALNDPSRPPAAWYGAWTTHFEASRQRWAKRIDEMHKAGFTWCEAVARSRIDGLNEYAASDPFGRMRFGHPIADPRFRTAYFAAPIQHRTGVRVGVGHKHLLRLVARRYLPAIVSEHRKIGPSNQVAVLTASPKSDSTHVDTAAADWLGLDLDPSFERPWELPAGAGLDWTQIHALLGWANNRIDV